MVEPHINFKCTQILKRSRWQERFMIRQITYFVRCFHCTVNFLYVANEKRMEQLLLCFYHSCLLYWMQLDFSELALISSEHKISKCQWTLMRQRALLQEMKGSAGCHSSIVENKLPVLCTPSYCFGHTIVPETYEGHNPLGLNALTSVFPRVMFAIQRFLQI